MNVHVSIASTPPDGVSAIGHLVFEGPVPADDGIELDPGACERRGFAGKAGESLVEAEGDHLRVLVGVGARDAVSATAVRRAAATFARAVSNCQSACLVLGPIVTDALSAATAAQAAVEGVGGATYDFSRYRSAERPAALSSVVLTVAPTDEGAAAEGVARGAVLADAVALARDLVNTPAADMTPSRMAEVAREVADRSGLSLTVLDEAGIRAEHLGGLWGVARGSAEPPRLIKLTYEPDGPEAASAPTVAVVGKGITFDSGGLSLKSGDGMMAMKDDMSGAAVVLASLGACRAMGVKVRVIGIAPCTENMPSGTATKPGDVLTTRNGKTIEVLNTDAEGRLVLADGLALAAESEPDAIVDVATLTGACVVALGPEVAGLMGNDSRLVAALEQAAERAGEPVWHLPLPQSYKKLHESNIADMKNIGRPGGPGALLAGLILEEFVGDRPWVHVDIAGPANTDEEAFDQRKGATGFGVRTVVELLSSYEAIGAPADHAADGSVR
ncbi:MAG TPA: leucyl aminopeptidase [Acidimicrobiales bacterium]|nr:leucyl aminopeptidase [Acidimicrobiales bacterium]